MSTPKKLRFDTPEGVIALGRMITGIAALLLVFTQFSDLPFLREVFWLFPPFIRELAFLLFMTGLLITVVGSVMEARRRQNEKIREKEKEAQIIEASRNLGESIDDFLKGHIRLAIAREQIAMLQAKNRGDQLYFPGVFLLGISVLCPVMAAAAYWNLDPLPPTVLTQLVDLKAKIGELPKDLSISVGRDWRLLVGGVAFGFLCLAAARGLLTQQGREMKTYFEVGERVAFFERLASVVDIRIKQGLTDGQGMIEKKAERELVDFVVDSLRRGPISNETKDDKTKDDGGSDHSSILKTAADAVSPR